MKKFITVIFVTTANFFVLASEIILWPSSADYKSKVSRINYFKNIAKRKNAGENTPEVEYHIPTPAINNNSLLNWGSNWIYNGPIEKWAQRIIQDFDNQENVLNILVPGCGKGRDLLNFFINTKYANITGIDISKDEVDYFQDNLRKLKITSSRLNIIRQDFREYLKVSQNNKVAVDFYYMVNFLHFFKLEEIRFMLQHIKNNLDDNGLVFLSWYGYDPEIQYNFGIKDKKLEKLIEAQYKDNVEDPGYIETEHRNYISLENMAKIADEIGLNIIHSQYYKTACIMLDILPLHKIMFFDYAFVPYNKQEILRDVPICQMILGKQT